MWICIQLNVAIYVDQLCGKRSDNPAHHRYLSLNRTGRLTHPGCGLFQLQQLIVLDLQHSVRDLQLPHALVPLV